MPRLPSTQESAVTRYLDSSGCLLTALLCSKAAILKRAALDILPEFVRPHHGCSELSNGLLIPLRGKLSPYGSIRVCVIWSHHHQPHLLPLPLRLLFPQPGLLFHQSLWFTPSAPPSLCLNVTFSLRTSLTMLVRISAPHTPDSIPFVFPH